MFEKTYFIRLNRNREDGRTMIVKSFFYHKPLFWSKRRMIAWLIKQYPEWAFKSIERVR